MCDDIGKRIESIMTKESLNYRSMGNKINLSDVVVRNVITGRNKPSFDFLINLIQTFDWINLQWLITGEGEMSKQKTKNISHPSDITITTETTEREHTFSPIDSDMIHMEIVKLLTETNASLVGEVQLMRGNRPDYMSALSDITNSLKSLSSTFNNLSATVADLSNVVNRIDKRLTDVEDRLDAQDGEKKAG